MGHITAETIAWRSLRNYDLRGAPLLAGFREVAWRSSKSLVTVWQCLRQNHNSVAANSTNAHVWKSARRGALPPPLLPKRLEMKRYTRGNVGHPPFELHPGSISLGCITTNKNDPNAMRQFNDVNTLLDQENGSNGLTVVP